MDVSDRYNKTYTHNGVEFYLSDYILNPEECRYIILKVLDQAIRDYCSLHSSELPNEKFAFATANAFLFDDEYRIGWGEKEFSTEEFLMFVDLDLEWVREQAKRKFKEKNNGTKKKTRRAAKRTKR
jgi:hypothetical protein